MKIKDKKLALLKSLYNKKFDGKYYDVEEIIGSFTATNRSESFNIAKALNDEGLIKMLATKDGTAAEITSYGVEYVEEEGHERPYEPLDAITPEERETIKAKLDEFANQLRRLELGQQITYDDLTDELETLKKLLTVLGKKDWLQILKGKLVDAGFGQLTEKVFELLIETFKDDKLLNG